MDRNIPERLVSACRGVDERINWLERLPSLLQTLAFRWSLTIGAPFADASCAWVAPVTHMDGTSSVLKIGMPHMEGEHEADGLRFWNGEPTVSLLEVDDEAGAMLLERCEPGTPLGTMAESEQDVTIASMLRRLWRVPTEPHPFRRLSEMTALWASETQVDIDRWPDAGLVREGLNLFQELGRAAPGDVLLATDLHAGNVLRARREPWLVIDPKPFVGDPAYDATQHLLNRRERLRSDPDETIRRMVDLLGLEFERVKLWTFARAAAGPREDWDDESMALARSIAP
jgi:streptomycin 6-kinase